MPQYIEVLSNIVAYSAIYSFPAVLSGTSNALLLWSNYNYMILHWLLAGYLLLLDYDPGHLLQAPLLGQNLEEGYKLQLDSCTFFIHKEVNR